MNWNKLTSEEQIDQLIEESTEKPVLLFKHSTRCSISSMSLDRLLRNWKSEDSAKITPYYLDLIAYRTLSNLVAERFDIPHESPQVLLIERGKVTYHESHYGISYAKIMK
ncbi:MAG: bacillithiol system redox-active protein YtxJ [Bacteroidetes bacterium]|nr:bacillithiol system redox-active protein YtxJ [Bacteroidota bacterium]MDA1267531.1 bacillithiol system redox-active protein YtxJ [Bacteroidota bacterium]